MKQFRKGIAFVLVFLFLIPLTSLPSVNGQSQQVTITPDGLVIGTNAITRNENTYTLTENLKASIIIQKDNIVLDGAMFQILGSDQIIKEGVVNQFSEINNETAIFIKDMMNVTIKNFDIIGYKIGVGIYESTSITVSGCRFNQDENPIYLDSASNNWITNNEATTISFCAIKLQSSNYNIISKNNVQNSSRGIIIKDGSNNLVVQNNFTYGQIGISTSSSNNLFTANNISETGEAVSLGDSSNSVFSKNIFSKNGIGIYAQDEARLIKNIIFTQNSFIENRDFVTLGLNSENSYRFYQNNFINRIQTVGFEGEYFYSGDTPPQYTPQLIENHNWDNGTYGNYWSDYKTKYPNAKEDVNNSQIFDTPYVVTPLNYPYLFYDYHPLTNPVIFTQDSADLSSWLPITSPTQQTQFPEIIILLAIVILIVFLTSIAFMRVYRRHRKT
jgi:parallel beta-helix repeat protein